MDDFKLRNKENYGVSKTSLDFEGYENKMKGPLVGGVMMKRLADISNLQQQPLPPIQDSKLHQGISLDIHHHIGKLEKENMMLLKTLADRNKSIDLAWVELQQLRINLQNLQQQNSQLAESNSQMLAELNMGKDRLRICQHELGCKNGLLKAMKAEVGDCSCSIAVDHMPIWMLDLLSAHDSSAFLVQTALKMTCQTLRKLIGAEGEINSSDPLQVEAGNNQCKTDRRQRSKAVGTSLRQSAVSTNVPCEACDVGGFASLLDNQEVEGNPTPSGSVKEAAEKEGNVLGEECEKPRRMSTRRPLRRAVEKVQSYKEVPLNVKMRREQ